MGKEDNFVLLDAFRKKCFVIDWPLCRILMEDKEFPWIFLIPRRPNIRQMNHLSPEDRLILMEEITVASNLMEQLFPTDMLNVAAIGNKTPQLHIHIISRNKQDSLWPDVVWGRQMQKLPDDKMDHNLSVIRTAFAAIPMESACEGKVIIHSKVMET
ncbi:MAG: HIT domain-containing protein [Holosporaceae bacterium]|jgi:diadenosine tetraphosphate (Ap4A) HIT family hydrolase|nr:HIT domain-containing protein [Holosporaceae bacterium]